MSATEIVAANIKDIIKASGLKQKAVAEKSGFGDKEFSNLLNGRKRIGAEHIPAIANALGVTPNDLYKPRESA